MEFIYGSGDFRNINSAEENCLLLTNGLGGYSSVTTGFGVNRCDHGLLVSAETAPNQRNMILHRIKEEIRFSDGKKYFLSTQQFNDGTLPEEGFRHLSFMRQKDGRPVWQYSLRGLTIRRRLGMQHRHNRIWLLWEISNRSGEPAELELTPFFTFCPKGEAPERVFPMETECGSRGEESPGKKEFRGEEACGRVVLRANQLTAEIYTNGKVQQIPVCGERLQYEFDRRDGRKPFGLACSSFRITASVEPGEDRRICLTCSSGEADLRPEDLLFEAGRLIRPEDLLFEAGRLIRPEDLLFAADGVFRQEEERREALLTLANLKDPVARQLVLAADDYLSEKESTGGKTLLAGYPFFGDWGRDTMISLRGCMLAAGRLEETKDILRTFLKYEKDGLVPNLFPDKNQAPMYNSVDAPLLLINSVYLYYSRTKDLDFVREAWPVMKEILTAYRTGTHYEIHMDSDGLIMAGTGKYQLTWMDVCVNGFLPTPRHGKPVEINAYWYNDLKIMDLFAGLLEEELPFSAGQLAEGVKKSFREKFWMEENGYLKDLVSGTGADEQIRCNQIWALSLPFTMLEKEEELRVLACVKKHLYTPLGLRTLSPEDKDFRPVYGGDLWSRDTAYHQGTVWPFPLGAYYLAYLKAHGSTPEAAAAVREALEPIKAALREGCIGQLPEIYDGLYPGPSRGCFAQAWSVGEMLCVYSRLEEIEREDS